MNMQSLIFAAVMSLLARLDFGARLKALWTSAADDDEMPRPVLDRIEYLVRYVDARDLPGEQKMREVVRMLRDPESPVRGFAVALATHSLRWAIETAYMRLRRAPGA